MNNWFECRVKYDKIDEQSGKEKTVTEPYLVDALSFTEAEERIHKYMEGAISGEFEIVGIKKEKLADVFPFKDADKWYKCKVVYVYVDEDTGKEKESSFTSVIRANNIDQARDRFYEKMKGVIVPFELKSVSETKIVDVLFHE